MDMSQQESFINEAIYPVTHETVGDRFRKNKAAVVGLVLICVMMMVALLAPLLAPYSPYLTFEEGISLVGAPAPPSAKFPLGADNLGRDVLSRLIYASRISLEVGLIAAVVSVAVGTLLGVMAGFWGGWVDLVIMRFTDAMLAFPFLLFVILVVSVLKPSVTIIFVVIGLLGWAKAARVARGQTLSIMQNNFIDASRVVGASSWRIIFHHIIPNIMGPLIVLTTLQVGNYILTEGALSYIGAGVPQPIPSWGSMIYTGQQYYQTAPWLMLYPGLMLTLTVIGFNLVGDGLDAALNPRN
jgi:ABC-type dipeptide/oligopeptide/nickel transport system permease subunit